MAYYCCTSAEEKAALRRSKEIDRYLKEDKTRMSKEMWILVLGANGSGKSTFVKQMRILYGDGYSEQDRLDLRPSIYATILNGMRRTLIKSRQWLQIPLQNPQNEQNCQVLLGYSGFMEANFTDTEFSPYVEPLIALWKDEGIQATVKRSSQYDLVGKHVCSRK